MARKNKRTGKPVSQTTRRTTLKAVRQALGRGVELGYAQRNVAKDVQMPKEPAYAARPFESWDEVRRVATALENPVHGALVISASATGLRPGEWRALEWRDVNTNEKQLHVNRSVQDGASQEGVAKSDSSLRTVLLSNLALEALKLLPTPLNRQQLVFPGKDRGLLNLDDFRARPWKKALEQAGVAYREPYAMRDTFATLTLADEAPLEWIGRADGTRLDRRDEEALRAPAPAYRARDPRAAQHNASESDRPKNGPTHGGVSGEQRWLARVNRPLCRIFVESGRRDLNSGPLVPQTSALTRLRHAP
jgi:integrase